MMTTRPLYSPQRRHAPADSTLPPRKRRRIWPWFLVGCPLGCLVLVVFGLSFSLTGGLLIGTVFSTQGGQGGTSLVPQQTADSAEQAATRFLGSLEKGLYEEAYGDLSSTVAFTLSQPEFVRTAQATDRCDGAITGYQEVSKKDQKGDGRTITYQVTRQRLHSAYQLVLTLQTDGGGAWSISGFSSGNQSLSLVPGQSSCN